MLTHNIRWSHAAGNQMVPSPWQATDCPTRPNLNAGTLLPWLLRHRQCLPFYGSKLFAACAA